MAILIGSIALFVAIVSLWSTTETNKRYGNQNNAFVDSRIRGLKRDIEVTTKAHEKAIKALLSRIKSMEDEAKISNASYNRSMKTLDKLLKNNREKEAIRDSTPSATASKRTAA